VTNVDEEMAQEAPTKVITPATAPAAGASLSKDALVVIAFFPILLRAIGARDATTVLNWLQSSDGATFLAIAVPAAISFWRARHAKQKKQTLLDVATGKVAAVVATKQGPVA